VPGYFFPDKKLKIQETDQTCAARKHIRMAAGNRAEACREKQALNTS